MSVDEQAFATPYSDNQTTITTHNYPQPKSSLLPWVALLATAMAIGVWWLAGDALPDIIDNTKDYESSMEVTVE